jgi:hypothetical protein
MPDAPDTADHAEADEADEETVELAKLRAEAARRRVEAREATERADELARRLTAAVIASEAGPLLADPEDLGRFHDGPLTDDAGFPDPAAVRAAAEALAEARPHLAGALRSAAS